MKIKLKEFTVEILEEPFCEHCGDMAPFTPIVDEGVSYCLMCHMANTEVNMSDEEELKIEIVSTRKQVKHYKKLHKAHLQYLKKLLK